VEKGPGETQVEGIKARGEEDSPKKVSAEPESDLKNEKPSTEGKPVRNGQSQTDSTNKMGWKSNSSKTAIGSINHKKENGKPKVVKGGGKKRSMTGREKNENNIATKGQEGLTK